MSIISNMKLDQEDIDESVVVLDTYNSDLNLVIDASKYSAHPLTNEGFAFMWAGVRATHGAAKGKICFEVKVLEHLDISHLPVDEPNPNVVRVGVSVENSSLQLGEEPLSYGYGGTGKISTNCQFKDFSGPFMANDCILCVVDFESDQVQIGYAKNGNFLGWAFKVNKSELQGRALLPHILTKNCSFEVNFGQSQHPYFPLPDPVKDCTFIACLPIDQRIGGTRAPKAKQECEMLMMCGLPGSGKSVWAAEYAEKHPEKKFNVLGTNNIIDKMKVMGLPRRRNYAGRWDVLIQMATKCLNKMFEIGSKLRRNYILDQTNVYPSAQRRKMRNFEGFIRTAVVMVPTEEEFKRRCDKRDREEGKDIPDQAVLEMKANFKLPEVNDVFEEVLFTELQKEEAEKLVQEYNEEGKIAIGSSTKMFRSNEFGGNKGFDGGRGNFISSRGGFVPRGGFDANRGGRDFGGNRGPYDGSKEDFGGRGFPGRGGFEGGRGGFIGGRGGFDGNRGGFGNGRGRFDGSRGSFGGGRAGGFDGGRGGFMGGRGGFGSGNRGGFDGSRGGFDGGSRGGFDGGRGNFDGGRGSFDGGRGGYNGSRGGFDNASRGSFEGGRGGVDGGNRGSFDGARGGYNVGRGGFGSGRGGFDSGRGARRGGFKRGYNDGPGSDAPNFGNDSQSIYGYDSGSYNDNPGYGNVSGNFGSRGNGRGRGSLSQSGFSGRGYNSENNQDAQFSDDKESTQGGFDKGGLSNSRYHRGSRGINIRGRSGSNTSSSSFNSRGGYSNADYGRNASSNYDSGYSGYSDKSLSQSGFGGSSENYSTRDSRSYSSGSPANFKKESSEISEGSNLDTSNKASRGTGRPRGRTATRWSSETPQTYPHQTGSTVASESKFPSYGSTEKSETTVSTTRTQYENYPTYTQSTLATQGFQATPSYTPGLTTSITSQPWTVTQPVTTNPVVPPVPPPVDQSQWSQYYQQSTPNQYFSQYYGQPTAGTATYSTVYGTK